MDQAAVPTTTDVSRESEKREKNEIMRLCHVGIE